MNISGSQDATLEIGTKHHSDKKDRIPTKKNRGKEVSSLFLHSSMFRILLTDVTVFIGIFDDNEVFIPIELTQKVCSDNYIISPNILTFYTLQVGFQVMQVLSIVNPRDTTN